MQHKYIGDSMTKENDTQERLLTTRQASAATGFHQTHFNSIILAGTLPASKDEKGRWQIKQSDLDKYLSSKTVKPKRDKKFNSADPDKPETSLYTQLDEKNHVITEKEKLIADLRDQLSAVKSTFKELQTQTSEEINDLQHQLDDKDSEIAKIENQIEELTENNKKLLDQIFENGEFLRNTIRQFVEGFCPSQNTK